jgi:gluconate kinase
MKEDMIQSQLNALEEPVEDEYDVIRLDVGEDGSTVCQRAVAMIQEKLNAHRTANQGGM